MLRAPWILCIAAACAPLDETTTELPEAPDAAVDDAPLEAGGTRRIYGRVHRLTDGDRTIPDVDVEVSGVTARTDVGGTYAMDVPLPAPWLRVDATDQGYERLLMHLPDYGDALSVWVPLPTVEEVAQILGLIAATAPITPEVVPDLAHLVLIVSNVSDNKDVAGADVRVMVDGAPAKDVYTAVYSDALSTCLPRRAEGEVATTDPGCQGTLVVPELSDGAEVRIEVTHPTRECGRSAEQRVAGLATAELAYELQTVAGWVNLTGIECEPVDKH